jgi:RNA polymerase sigma-70 factor, ECF subfamily
VNKQITDKQFVELIQENKGLILKICIFYTKTNADLQDLFQDIVMNAWKGYQSFRNDSKFSTWLYSVALHTALFSQRKKRVVSEPLTENIPDQDLPYKDIEQSDEMYAAINRLNDIEKSIVLLYLDGYSYDEMEKITGISNATLRVKMNRVKLKLKNIVK